MPIWLNHEANEREHAGVEWEIRMFSGDTNPIRRLSINLSEGISARVGGKTPLCPAWPEWIQLRNPINMES
jgi:hypothetical protein